MDVRVKVMLIVLLDSISSLLYVVKCRQIVSSSTFTNPSPPTSSVLHQSTDVTTLRRDSDIIDVPSTMTRNTTAECMVPVVKTVTVPKIFATC